LDAYTAGRTAGDGLAAVAAAERAFALIERWGKPKNIARARAILDELWEISVAPTPATAARLADLVEGLPDAKVNDPEFPHQTALEALFNAARILGGVRHSGDLMTPDLFSELDALAEEYADGPRIRFVDPRNPPPAGPFEAEEEQRVLRDQREAAVAGPAVSWVAFRTRAEDERRDLANRLGPLVEFSRDIRRR